jgi:hypothetical protein
MRAAVVTVALFLAPALALPQSLGDAARKQARERSKQPPPRVYTETDLHESGDAPAAAPADPPAPSTGTDAPAGSATQSAKEKSEDAVRAQLDREAEARKERERKWRRLAGAARARIAEAQRGYDAVCGSGAVVLPGG